MSSEVWGGISRGPAQHQSEQWNERRKCFFFGSRERMESSLVFLHLAANLQRPSPERTLFYSYKRGRPVGRMLHGTVAPGPQLSPALVTEGSVVSWHLHTRRTLSGAALLASPPPSPTTTRRASPPSGNYALVPSEASSQSRPELACRPGSILQGSDSTCLSSFRKLWGERTDQSHDAGLHTPPCACPLTVRIERSSGRSQMFTAASLLHRRGP